MTKQPSAHCERREINGIMPERDETMQTETARQAVKYEYEINISAEPSECSKCGENGDSVTIEQLEEGIKALDVAIRSRRKAGRAGRNLDTKVRIEHQRRTIEKLRAELLAELRTVLAFEKAKAQGGAV